MKAPRIMDLYSDFLMTSPNIVSALLLENILDKEYSHDSITRMLAQHELSQKEYWLKIKPLVRQIESDKDGVIAIDDTIEEKPHSGENELISWHHDHSKKGKDKMVKGIQILTFTYVQSKKESKIQLPIAFDLVRKDIRYKDAKTGKEKRKSSISKNELLQQRLKVLAHHNNVQFKYVCWDKWFSSASNMRFVVFDIKRHFVCPIKSNRTISFDLNMDKKASKKEWVSVTQANLEPNKVYSICLKDVPFKLSLMKKVYHNLDGSVGVQYLVTSDTDLNYDEIDTVYEKRWSSEELHRSLKQNTGLEKMPAKKEDSQANHIFASMLAQVKLEALKISTKQHHYALKRNILIQSLKNAWKEIQKLKELCLEKNIQIPNFRGA